MSEATPDLGRIVSLIMENPKLIEEISNMAKGRGTEGSVPSESSVANEEKEEVGAVKEASVTPEIPTRSHEGKNRSKLLGALKPYVSRERAQAIDSMLSIVEILDAMTGRK